MNRLLVAVALAAVAVAAAAVARRRRAAEAPTQPTSGWVAPAQLDRADFARPDAPWLVALFTSATCDSCRSTIEKAGVLDSQDVAVEVVDSVAGKGVHTRYHIEAVPIVCIADHAGVVVRSFIGPVTATDLWAAVAEARDPEIHLPSACHEHHE